MRNEPVELPEEPTKPSEAEAFSRNEILIRRKEWKIKECKRRNFDKKLHLLIVRRVGLGLFPRDADEDASHQIVTIPDRVRVVESVAAATELLHADIGVLQRLFFFLARGG